MTLVASIPDFSITHRQAPESTYLDSFREIAIMPEIPQDEVPPLAAYPSKPIFPENWPDGCPPHDSIDAAGVVFRIVDHNPPVSGDFVTHFESGRLPKADECLRCGLSVFREMRDAIHQRRLLPKLGRLIAHGTLNVKHGKTKLTTGKQPTHTTWWPYFDADRASAFSIAPEEG